MKRLVLFALIAALAVPTIAFAQGADVYKSKCAMCHGPDGAGTSTGKAMGATPLGGAAVQAKSDADLAGEIENGKGKMPAYKGKLTDAQVKDLVAYIRTLKK